MSPEETLSYMMECNLTVHAYKKTRTTAKLHKRDLYPSYDRVLNAKICAYPEITEITGN